MYFNSEVRTLLTQMEAANMSALSRLPLEEARRVYQEVGEQLGALLSQLSELMTSTLTDQRAHCLYACIGQAFPKIPRQLLFTFTVVDGR